MKQSEMIDKFIPILEKNGIKYNKKTIVLAKKARGGEKVYTYTSDGKETENTAKKDDYRIKNLTDAGEEYLISEKKFVSRYIRYKDLGIWSLYKATGSILAVQFDSEKHGLPGSTEFEASWGESMTLRNGDFLASPLPDKNEIYRIGKKEFEETYEKD